MTIAAWAGGRRVTEILHYTSEKGVLGSVMKGAVLSRERIESDPELAFIYSAIWEERRDPEWIDYISLSVSRVNLDLFRRSRNNHPQFWWAVMSFDPTILDHADVWFTTTNNVYEEVCERDQGIAGFQAMFADHVPWGYFGSVRNRIGLSNHFPTDFAAEVLYPGELPLTFLRRLYVPGRQHRRMVDAWCEVYSRPPLPIEIDPGAFA